jgi:hypothetical protein
VRKLLLQLDSSPQPSVFDRVVAFDGGADDVMSYGGVDEATVRDLVHGAIFTRGPKDLHHTAIFIGGTDMAAGERLLAAVRKAFFGPLRVSVMLDSNGSNTTAVAAVAKAGADVAITSRRPEAATHAVDAIRQRFGATVRASTMPDGSHASAALEGAELLLNAGLAGVCLVPRDAWVGRAGLRAVTDLNAVPPLGVDGVEVQDDGVEREGVTVFGALGVGKLKMKIHKACIARLFEHNDLVLDAETIADVARDLASTQGGRGFETSTRN